MTNMTSNGDIVIVRYDARAALSMPSTPWWADDGFPSKSSRSRQCSTAWMPVARSLSLCNMRNLNWYIMHSYVDGDDDDGCWACECSWPYYGRIMPLYGCWLWACICKRFNLLLVFSIWWFSNASFFALHGIKCRFYENLIAILSHSLMRKAAIHTHTHHSDIRYVCRNEWKRNLKTTQKYSECEHFCTIQKLIYHCSAPILHIYSNSWYLFAIIAYQLFYFASNSLRVNVESWIKIFMKYT